MNFLDLQKSKIKKIQGPALRDSKGFTRTLSSKVSGFTIIELLVVMFIFGVISSLVIFNYGSFQSDVSVENLAQDIGLTIRRAQVYSVGTKGIDTGTNTIFPSYGIHFSIPTGLAVAGNERAFVFFADVPPIVVPAEYDYSSSTCPNIVTSGDECMEIINITSSDKIVEICDGDTSVCYPTASLDIVFTRPNTEANFCFKSGGACSNPSNVILKVQSINGREKSINIWQSGQINVQ